MVRVLFCCWHAVIDQLAKSLLKVGFSLPSCELLFCI